VPQPVRTGHERDSRAGSAIKKWPAPASGRLDTVDTLTPGLVLRVTSNGVKSFCVRYRPKGGVQKRHTIGVYPIWELGKARVRAADIIAAAGHGVDLPAQEEAERQAARRAAARPTTIGELLKRYVAGYCQANQRKWKLTRRMFEMHVEPTLGSKALVDLRRADIVELLDDLQNKEGFAAQVNRVRSQLVAALNWAVEREWVEHNVAATIKKRKIEAPRERVLTRDELRAIWQAADRLSEPSRAFIKMLVSDRPAP
jgi:hypothetical protein